MSALDSTVERLIMKSVVLSYFRVQSVYVTSFLLQALMAQRSRVLVWFVVASSIPFFSRFFELS